MKKFFEKAGKVAERTGKAAGEGYNFLKLSMRLGIAVCALLIVYLLYDGGRNAWRVISAPYYLLVGVNKTPEERLVDEKQRIDNDFLLCAAAAGSDDFLNAQQRFYAAVTVVNVANERAQRIVTYQGGRKTVEIIADTCSVFERFETLMPLGKVTGQHRWVWSIKTFGGVRQSQLDQTTRMLREYLADPAPFLQERPIIKEYRRYIRTTGKRFLKLGDPDEIRRTMCLVSGTQGQGEFFAFKKMDGTCPK